MTVKQIRSRSRELTEQGNLKRKRAIQRRRRHRQVMIRRIIALIIAILIIFLIVRGVIAIVHLFSKKAGDAGKSQKKSKAPAEKVIEPAEITMSFTGDIILGMHQNAVYSTSMCAYYDNNGPDYSLKKVPHRWKKRCTG